MQTTKEIIQRPIIPEDGEIFSEEQLPFSLHLTVEENHEVAVDAPDDDYLGAENQRGSIHGGSAAEEGKWLFYNLEDKPGKGPDPPATPQ